MKSLSGCIIDVFSNVTPLKLLVRFSSRASAQTEVPLDHLCGGFGLAARAAEETWLV